MAVALDKYWKTQKRFPENPRRSFKSVDDAAKAITKKNYKLTIPTHPELPSTREPALKNIKLEDRNKQDMWKYIDEHAKRLAKQ